MLHRDKQLSTLRGYAPDKLGQHLRVDFQFWKWGGMRPDATNNAAVRGVKVNDKVCV
jgi:hypothetical protein